MIQDLLRSRHGEDEFTTEVCRNRSQWRVAGAESHCTETVHTVQRNRFCTAEVYITENWVLIIRKSSYYYYLLLLYDTRFLFAEKLSIVEQNRSKVTFKNTTSLLNIDWLYPSFHHLTSTTNKTDWLNIKHRTSVSIMPSEFNSCDWMENNPVSNVKWWQWHVGDILYLR